MGKQTIRLNTPLRDYLDPLFVMGQTGGIQVRFQFQLKTAWIPASARDFTELVTES